MSTNQEQNVVVPRSTLAKQASLIGEMAQRLEKNASTEADFEKCAEIVVDSLIEHNKIAADQRDASIQSIKSGGLTRLGEVFTSFANEVAEAPVSLGSVTKEASAQPASPSDNADAIWRGQFG